MGSKGKVEFSKIKGFPKVTDDGKIETGQFLAAAKEILQVFESLGTIFSPVTNDINGNITKLSIGYNADKEAYHYLETFVLESSKIKSSNTISSLLWLNRGLELIEAFLLNVIQDEKQVKGSIEYFQVAYEATLKKHHNYIAKKAASFLSRLLPSKAYIFGTGEDFDENVKYISSLAPYFGDNVKAVNLILEKVL